MLRSKGVILRIKEFLRSHPGLNTALGILFAVFAGLLLLGYISKAIDGDDAGEFLRVPVAAHDIDMGASIEKGDIKIKNIPTNYTVPGCIESQGDIMGSRALRFIGKGEPFLKTSITGGEGSNALAARIPDDLRAYTLQPGSQTGSASDLRPGDRVDVLSTCGDPPITSTILRNIYVISVGRGKETTADGRGADAIEKITLLVSPVQAELLAQAEYSGEISISLCPMAKSNR